MRGFLLRMVVNGIAIAITAAILPGIHVSDNSIATLAIIAFVFGLANAFIKPVLLVLSCPLMILTLGLFYLIVNGVMLLITDAVAGDRFTIDTIWWAVLGGLIIGIIGGILEGAFGLDDDDDTEGVVIIHS